MARAPSGQAPLRGAVLSIESRTPKSRGLEGKVAWKGYCMWVSRETATAAGAAVAFDRDTNQENG